MGILEFAVEDGVKVEPRFLLPILPIHVINGARGIGTGHSTFIANHRFTDILMWFKYKLTDTPWNFEPLKPYYNDFVGNIEELELIPL